MVRPLKTIDECLPLRNSNCCGHGGHLRSHIGSYRGQLTDQLMVITFHLMSLDMGLEQVMVAVMEVIGGHILGHTEVN